MYRSQAIIGYLSSLANSDKLFNAFKLNIVGGSEDGRLTASKIVEWLLQPSLLEGELYNILKRPLLAP